jgi:BMFP domain-containing protein YqiC
MAMLQGFPIMQTRNRLFDDAARIAGGAVGTLAGAKREIEALVRQQLERMLTSLDLVTRDELEAVKEMAAKARSEQEVLEERLAALENKLAGKRPSSPKPKSGSRAKKTGGD